MNGGEKTTVEKNLTWVSLHLQPYAWARRSINTQ